MKHEPTMATRTPIGPGRKPGESCTEFQLHKSQIVEGRGRNVYDYTEFRLRLYIKQVKDDVLKSALVKVLSEYVRGIVVVAWKSGKPIWLSVTKG